MSSVIAVHLGAGMHSDRYLASYEKLCTQAVKKAVSELIKGEPILNAVAEATSVLEDSPLTNAGAGSNLTFDGTVECDASIMDGETFACGSVCALTCVRNPIKAALALAKQSNTRLTLGRVPPCIMTGEGAKKWVRDCGTSLHDCPSESLITEQSKRMHVKCMMKLARLSSETGSKIQFSFIIGPLEISKQRKSWLVESAMKIRGP